MFIIATTEVERLRNLYILHVIENGISFLIEPMCR